MWLESCQPGCPLWVISCLDDGLCVGRQVVYIVWASKIPVALLCEVACGSSRTFNWILLKVPVYCFVLQDLKWFFCGVYPENIFCVMQTGGRFYHLLVNGYCSWLLFCCLYWYYFNLMLNTLFSVITTISIVTLYSSCLLILMSMAIHLEQLPTCRREQGTSLSFWHFQA